MRTLPLQVDARLYELKRRLEERGLGFPESQRRPGLPHFYEVGRLIGASEGSFGLRGGAPTPARVLVERLAAELGLMPFDEFQERTRGDVGLFVPTRREDETFKALDAWINKTRRARLKVPEKEKARGAPYFALIAKAAGIDPIRLAHPECPYRHTLLDFVEEVGFMDARDYVLVTGIDFRNEHQVKATEARLDAIRQYIHRHHIEPNVGLPEGKHSRGTPNYREICENAGKDYRGVNADKAVVCMVDDAAQIVGVGEDRFRPVLDLSNITYGELLRRGVERFKLEQPCASKSSVDRFASALRKWQAERGRNVTDQVGSDFGAGYREAVSEIAASISNSDTRRHWLGTMARWFGYFSTLTTSDVSLPDTFAGALRALRRKTKMKSFTTFLRSEGLERHFMAIRSWESGRSEPVRGDRTIIERLELAYSVEPGTLTKRVRKFYRVATGDFRIDVWPSSLDTDGLRALAKPLLPDNFPHLSDEEREAIGLIIRAEAQTTIPFRKRMRALETWRIQEYPERVKAEWAELVEYKTCLLPKLDRATEWAEATVERNWNIVTEYLSALALDPAAGGLGLGLEHLTLALCGNANLIHWFTKWKMARGENSLDTGARTWLGFLAHITTSEVKDVNGNGQEAKGFLHYVPHWATRVRPIPGYVSAEDIELLQTEEGWATSLRDASGTASLLYKRVRSGLKLARDPFEPIMPILDLDQPYDVLIQMLDDAYDALPDPRRTSEYKRAIAVRRLVSALIFVRTALRRKNVANLTFLHDGKGQMKRLGHGWRIEIPASQFKNHRGPFFGTQTSLGRAQNAYIYDFDEEDTPILDEYASVCRKYLLDQAGRTSDAFFINKKGNKASHDSHSEDMYALTWRHVVYHEVTGTGIKGVEQFGPHAVRDIVATDLLKTEGDLALAADAIQDSIETVKTHYARFLTSDRTRRVQAKLRARSGNRKWARASAAPVLST